MYINKKGSDNKPASAYVIPHHRTSSSFGRTFSTKKEGPILFVSQGSEKGFRQSTGSGSTSSTFLKSDSLLKPVSPPPGLSDDLAHFPAEEGERILNSRLKKAKTPIMIGNIITTYYRQFNSIHWAVGFNSLSKLPQKNEREKIELIKLAAQKIVESRPHLDAGQIVQIVNVIGHHNIQQPGLSEFLFEQASLHCNYYNEKELYMLCSGIRSWDVHGVIRLRLICDLEKNWFKDRKTPREFLWTLSPKALAAMYRMLACEFKRSKNPLREVIQDRINEFQFKEIVEIVNGVNKSRCLDQEFISSLVARAKELRHTIDARGYNNLLADLAQLNYCDEEWFQEIVVEMIERPEKFELYNQVFILGAIVRSGLTTDAAKTLALRIIQQNDLLKKCYVSDLTLFAVAFGFLFNTAHQELSHALIRDIKNHHNIDKTDRSEIFQAMLLTGVLPEAALEYFADSVCEDPAASQFQLEVTDKIREKIVGRGLILEEEVRIGNTYVDVVARGKKFEGKEIIIQVDGHWHFTIPSSKLTMHTLVNTRVLTAMGYHVIRIGIFDTEAAIAETIAFLRSLE